jgi:hypothetical protein
MQTNKKIKSLKKKKEKALRELNKNRDLIIGSLVYLRRRCGTEKKYGAYFLSRQEGGRTHLTYIPKGKVKEIREKVERYKKTKEIMKRISEINIKIFKEWGK